MKVRAKDIRKAARESLQGRYWEALALTLLVGLVSGVAGILAIIPIVGWIALFLIVVPLSYGYEMNLLRLKRGETKSITEFFKLGFDNFGRSWRVFGNTFIRLFLWFLIAELVMAAGMVCIGLATVGQIFSVYAIGEFELNIFVVLGLVVGSVIMGLGEFLAISKALLYELTDFVAIDNEELSGRDACEKCASMMKGNRWRYFCLNLSFIGWILLSMLTFGFGTIFLSPYMDFAKICFYDNLTGKDKETEVTTDVPEEAKEVEATPVVPEVKEEVESTPATEEPIIKIEE